MEIRPVLRACGRALHCKYTPAAGGFSQAWPGFRWSPSSPGKTSLSRVRALRCDPLRGCGASLAAGAGAATPIAFPPGFTLAKSAGRRNNILSQGLKALPVLLDHSNGQMSGFADVQVSRSSRFSFVRSVNYPAEITVFNGDVVHGGVVGGLN